MNRPESDEQRFDAAPSRARPDVLRQGRDTLLQWLRQKLMGPPPTDEQGEDIVLTEPLFAFPTGVLYPVIRGEQGEDAAAIDDDEDGSEPGESGEGDGGDVKAAGRGRRYVPPSSVGFSFFIKGSGLKIRTHCRGARYERNTDERDEKGRFVAREWRRIELDDARDLDFKPPGRDRIERTTEPCLAGRGQVDVLWRPFTGGWIVTVSLINRAEPPETAEYWEYRNELSIFEASLTCLIDAGDVGAYPRVDGSLLSPEELEIELQYQDRKIYAVGHGAAVDWTLENGRVTAIHTDFIPAVEVPLMTADPGGGADPVLSLSFLSRMDFEDQDGRAALTRFVDDYGIWVKEEQCRAADLPLEDRETGARITRRMEQAVARMRAGIAFLAGNHLAARAFRVANQAMLRQMIQADRCKGLEREATAYRWRPFQLAFLLTVLESTADDHSDLRDMVDLIWFPTGGGKTEAYLGLMAFVIAWRRYHHPSAGGGTAILMRYTLRLLTTQQFERATRMICALELIRRGDPDLGAESITSGLWVGGNSSPNHYHVARQLLDNARAGEKPPPRSLVFDKCPWCDAPFEVSRNYVATDRQFRFICRNPECDFGRSRDDFLPCNVVDAALYDEAPTLLVSTIDKFARLAWTDQPAVFFGGPRNRPPELIVQDELHLISGALGSIAGLYEAALDTVICQRGVTPKYIASTATIRMAREQCRALFGRDVSIFPPPGLSCDNAYFARTVPITEKSGRLYVGYFAPLLNRQECMAPLAAILLAGPEICFGRDADRDDLLEAWWTQIGYHGSIKGVGSSHNVFDSIVREYYRQLFETEAQTAAVNGGSDPAPSPGRSTPRIKALTSRSSPEENRDTFMRLEKTRSDPDHLDVVLATNMISVGLDVSRLALMIVNGQPLTTAEYIQASSRVGRGDAPGIVAANYYRDQARSISHYEDFRAYHEAFYRFVEPNSLTPFTYQARKRALHAALVIALRYTCPHLLPNEAAAAFDPEDQKTRRVINALKTRCYQADSGRGRQTADHIDTLVQEWLETARQSNRRKRLLKYADNRKDRASNRLLAGHDDQDRSSGLWPTLNSMRNVEDSALIRTL